MRRVHQKLAYLNQEAAVSMIVNVSHLLAAEWRSKLSSLSAYPRRLCYG